ncbi:MAG TPA: hypothetical protein VFQ91_21890 [Bryobacteraceae bacterium]|nr:hypothetical protein [Bryobacteraceae bacterium]
MLTSRLWLAVAAAAFLAWLALPGTFVFDDHSVFVDPAVVAGDAWRQWVRLEQTRPLTYITFWADYRLWGAAAGGFHFTNLLIHLACGAFLFLCGRRLFEKNVAWTAALVFLLHPLAQEPLLYVFARSSSLAALFCLAALWFWLRDRPGAAVLLFGVSLLAKEEWVAFPAALALIDRARRERQRWPYLGAMAGLAAAAGARVIYATKAVAGSGSGFGQSDSPWQYFLREGQAVPGYLWRTLLPIRMPLDAPAPWADLEAGIVGWAGLVLLAGAAAWFCEKKEVAGFWLLPAFAVLLPSSSFLPAADPVAWRRMYLPMAFLALGAALWLRPRPRAVWAVLLTLAVLAGLRRPIWQDEAALWRESQAAAPLQLRPYLQLSRLTARDEALRYLEQAKKIAPNDPEVASESGRVWLESGNAARALPEFGRALALAPGEARYVVNRGAVLLALGQRDAARADFERALRLSPCLLPARQNLERMGIPPPPPPTPCPTINSAAK